MSEGMVRAGRVLLFLATVMPMPGCLTRISEAAPSRSISMGGKVVVVNVDMHGAVVLDGRAREARGVRRDGSVAWRMPLNPRSPAPVGCLARCPDAVLSARGASMVTPPVSIPEPMLMVGGKRQQPAAFRGDRQQVLTATGPDDFVLTSGDGAGQWWLELHHAGTVDRVMVGGHSTSWRESADRREALAITHLKGANQARWFTKSEGRWRLAHSVTSTVAGFTSCVRPDGKRALLIGREPVTIDRAGVQSAVTDLQRAGTCAWSAEGGIVAALALRPGGLHFLLRTFDAAGNVTARVDGEGEVTVAGDPASPRVAYIVSETFHEIDARSGKPLRTIAGVHSALYTLDGTLVLVRSGGGMVDWLPQPQ